MTTKRKVHARSERLLNETLCGRTILKDSGRPLPIAEGRDVTCAQCVTIRLAAEPRPDKQETFALRHALVREDSPLPCRWQDIIHAHHASYVDLGRTVYGLHVWWWGYPPE